MKTPEAEILDQMKACPFCGRYEVLEWNSPRPSYFMECQWCGATGPVNGTIDKARSAWNERTEALVKVIEEGK